MADRREHAFNGVRGPQMVPMFGWKVEEGQQRFAILDQALDCFVVFRAVFFGKQVNRYLGAGPARRHVDLAQVLLHVGLHRERDLVQDVGGLVDPAPLMPRDREDLIMRFPEAECAIANSDFRGDPEPTAFCLDEQFAPALRAFRTPIWKPISSLLPFRRAADQHQHALAMIYHPGLQEDAIGPHTYRRADRSRCCQRSYSLCHSDVSREITAGDKFGASLPSKAPSASWKSPVEMPRR